MRRLAREAELRDPGADAAVELGQARAGHAERDSRVVDAKQTGLELAIAVGEVAGHEVLRVIAPVAVGADPDLEQRRLALDDRTVGRGRERADPAARPDEREAEGELDLPAPAGALAVDEAEPLGGRLRLGHSGPDHALDVLHRRRRDLVREPHPLDLLRRLQHPRLVEQRRRVLRVRERVEPRLREGRRLAHHPVGRLGAEGELDPDRLVLLGERGRQVERAERRRPRIALVVAREEPYVARPGRPLGILARRLEADQRRLALGGEDDGVVALHPPEVRQVEDVVGRADDERVEAPLAHERADAVELRVVARPAHRPRLPSGSDALTPGPHARQRRRAVPLLPGDDRVPQHADVLDLGLDHVAGLEVEQRALLGRLEARDARDRSRREHVTGRVARAPRSSRGSRRS